MENEVMKLEKKIRELLGNDYHLNVAYDENLEIKEWHLHRKYNDANVYFSDDNKEIMSSENYTLEDLYGFAKKHHKIAIVPTYNKIIIFVILGLFILSLINAILWKNSMLSYFIIGFDIAIIFVDILLFILDDKNFNVDMLELHEYFERDFKKIKEQLEKIHSEIEKDEKEEKSKAKPKTKPKARVKKEVKNEEHITN